MAGLCEADHATWVPLHRSGPVLGGARGSVGSGWNQPLIMKTVTAQFASNMRVWGTVLSIVCEWAISRAHGPVRKVWCEPVYRKGIRPLAEFSAHPPIYLLHFLQ